MPINRKTINQHLQERSIGLSLPVIVGFICGLESALIRTIVPFTFGRVMTVAGLNELFTVPVILASLVIGAYLTGSLTDRMREASGVGLDVAIESYHSRAGMLPAKFAPLKFLATLFTLGLGGSGGLVGPTAVIGQGTASYFSSWFKLSWHKSRILALCGIAGCVSGLLHVPFGAAVLALELCYLGGIIYEGFVPVLLSSISAYIMSARIAQKLPFGDLFQQPHLFRTTVYDTAFPWSLDHLAYCIIAALVTTLLGVLFIKTFLAFRKFSNIESKNKYGLVIGALFVGLIAILFFRDRPADVLGEPSALVERCATAGKEYSLGAAVALLIGRWATTFLTIGLGGSGGLFAPTVLMGGLAGTIAAHILNANIMVLVTTGTAAALAGVINVPIAAVIIVVEVFGVGFIIPAAIGSAVAFLLAKNVVIYPHIERIKPPEATTGHDI